MVNGKGCLRIGVMTGIIVIFGIYAGIRLSGPKGNYQNKRINVCLDKEKELGEEYSVDSILVIENIKQFFDYNSEKNLHLF